jgi:hypothetical protein
LKAVGLLLRVLDYGFDFGGAYLGVAVEQLLLELVLAGFCEQDFVVVLGVLAGFGCGGGVISVGGLWGGGGSGHSLHDFLGDHQVVHLALEEQVLVASQRFVIFDTQCIQLQ